MDDGVSRSFERRLFHVSDRGDIDRFVPRIAPTDPNGRLVVWAVDGAHLGHYLLPRDCPRVCFRAGASSTAADVATLLGGDPARRVVAIEQRWEERVRSTTLWRYELPPATFRVLDDTAGYCVSDDAFDPVAVEPLTDLAGELNDLGYDLVLLPSLHDLRERVVASSLPFSVIRWRYAGD